MKNRRDLREEVTTLERLISGRLETIGELKENLKHVHAVKDEIVLLRNLSDQIAELRELREKRLSIERH